MDWDVMHHFNSASNSYLMLLIYKVSIQACRYKRKIIQSKYQVAIVMNSKLNYFLSDRCFFPLCAGRGFMQRSYVMHRLRRTMSRFTITGRDIVGTKRATETANIECLAPLAYNYFAR